MRITVLGSGGCTVTPRPLCRCRVCETARDKGKAHVRTGPSIFLHDAHLLIDTPAEIAWQLDRTPIERLDAIMLTHLDPDHVEGIRVVEQLALDFRTWRAYPGKRVRLLLPEDLNHQLSGLQTIYGPMSLFFEEQGFLERVIFRDETQLNSVRINAIAIHHVDTVAFVYVFRKDGKKIIFAPCDIKPFPCHLELVHHADLLFIQPGMFETGLADRFSFPPDHVSRTTLYTFDETLALVRRIGARQTVFVHIEEYWNRTADDYARLEKQFDNIRFAHDGMQLMV